MKYKSLCLSFFIFSIALCGLLSAAPAPAKQELWYHPKATKLECPMGPFIRLADDEILTVNNREALVSKDEGKTWENHVIFSEGEPFSIRDERVLLQTSSGAVILAFMNDKDKQWKWNNKTHDTEGDVFLPTCVIRSTDGGRTWSKPRVLHRDWTGAIRDILQTRNGRIVFTSMMMLHNPGRHATVTYSSDDDGLTWTRSNIIDLGGMGHHGGVVEATIEELKNGRLWMLMRTAWDYFWEAFSDDGGLTWRTIRRSNIKASTAPGLVNRLADGRLFLIWNQLYPEGETTFKRIGGDGNWSEVPAVNHRREMSIAFSSDEGVSWSAPAVIARVTKGREDISYPFAFEIRPGELWVTTMRGTLAARFRVADIEPPATVAATTGRATTAPHNGVIVAFGDSTTAPRQGLTPYPALLEKCLSEKSGVAHTVINAGKPSDTTARAAKRFAGDVLSKNPALVIMQFGINDSMYDVWKNPPATAPRLPVTDYEANLKNFVRSVREQGGIVVLMTPNPIEWTDGLKARYGKTPYDPNDPQSLNKHLQPYAEAVRRVARQTNTHIVDIARACAVRATTTPSPLLLDGMHPNQAGHDLTATLLCEYLLKNDLLKN